MIFSVKARCLVADDEEGRRLDSNSHPGIASGSPEDPTNKRPNITSNSDLTSTSPSTRHTSTCRLGPLGHFAGEAAPPPIVNFSPSAKTSRTVVLPPLCEAEITEASAAVISVPGTEGPVSLAATSAVVVDVWGRESWYFEPTAPLLVDTKVRGMD